MPRHRPSQSPSRSGDGAELSASASAGRTPLCLIVDEESSIRHFVSLILQGTGIDTMEFADGSGLRAAKPDHPPDLVFLNVNLDAADAMQSLETLGRAGFPGAVQLMSNRGAAVLENLRQIGEQHRLRMLPVLKKPFETSAIQKIVSQMRLGHQEHDTVRVPLTEALANRWIEFWYQPKIDMRRKRLAGAELFARVKHPQYGILLPGSFMPDATEAGLVTLAERALTDALASYGRFAELGVHLRMAINVSFAALARLPVEDMVRAHRPADENWPGLIFDVTEEQVIQDISLASELHARLSPHNVLLAIDDFGKAHAALSNVTKLPFAEMKLDRSFVTDCGTDRANAPVCKTVINLAHSFGALAVGIGVEKASELTALVSMGCDLGQGFLLGQPMPEERFLALLRQRANVRPTPSTLAFAAASHGNFPQH